MTKSTNSLDDVMISANEAARLIGVTADRVRQLAREGHIPKAARNRYRLVDVVEGYVTFLKDDERRSSVAQSESGLKAARQREVELRIAEREREVVPRDEAEAAMDLVVGKVNAEMSGFAARVTRDIGLRRKIETEMQDSLVRVSEALDFASKQLASGDEDDDEAT